MNPMMGSSYWCYFSSFQIHWNYFQVELPCWPLNYNKFCTWNANTVVDFVAITLSDFQQVQSDILIEMEFIWKLIGTKEAHLDDFFC